MDRAEAIETLNANSKEWLAAILKDGGEGFGENIIDFEPEPAEDNNWLWNEEEGQYSGKIMDDRGNSYEFKIMKEGDDWSTSTKMVSGEIDGVDGDEVEEAPDSVPVEDVEMAEEPKEDEDKTVMKENGRCWDGYEPVKGKKPFEKGSCKKIEMAEDVAQMEEMKKELAELRQQVALYQETKKNEAKQEMNQFCEDLYDDGILTEGIFPKPTLKLVLEGILNASLDTPMMYSEGDEEVNVLDGLKTLFRNLPKQVEFNEATTRAIDTPLVDRVPKQFGNVDKEAAKEYNKIMKYMEDKNISNFTEARRRMYREQG